uniref:Peptidase M48 domain-containing protein n=1 Tax=Lygus hesperus TaxID=30085 RepID=A0A0A9W555_LYGHE
METLTVVLLVCMIAVEGWKLYLVWRKWKSFTEYPPEILKPIIKDEDYKGLRIATFVQCTSMAREIIVKLTLKVLKLSLDYHEFLWDTTLKYAQTDMSRDAWYIALDIFMTLCIEKPFELVGLLILRPEEHHKIINHLGHMGIEIVTASLLGGVVARGAVFIASRFGALNLLLPVLVFEFFGLFMLLWATLIVLPWICRPLAVNSEAEAYVMRLAESVGFPEKKILVDVTEGRPANTFYYGLFGNYILVINLEMINKLSPRQTVAQVAHELGHWNYGHSVTKMAFNLAEIMIFTILTVFVYIYPVVNEVFGLTYEKSPHPIVRSYLSMYYIWPVMLQMFKGPSNIILAGYEYQADRWACGNGHGEHLKSGLLIKKVTLMTPEFDNWYSSWFYGVPTVLERVKRIGICEVENTPHGDT